MLIRIQVIGNIGDMVKIPEDPRILRTRRLLQDALGNLLQEKEFDQLSVADIAEAATLNRATFYDHYADKFQLLACMVGRRFNDLLAARQVHFDGTCAAALKALVLAVCDYLSEKCPCKKPLQPHMESAIIAVVRQVLLDGLRQHPPEGAAAPAMLAAAASWAIYGAAKEWVETKDRCSAEEIADTIVTLVSPILQLAAAPPAET